MTADPTLRFYADPEEFLAAAGAYLAADPVVSTVVASVTRRMAARRAEGVTLPEDDWWLVVRDASGAVVGAAMRTAPEPMLVLPAGGIGDLNYMLWSTDGFPRITNGLGGFEPVTQAQTRVAVATFPDAGSVAYLRGIGVRSVVAVPSRAAGTPWEGIENRPVDGLGITREDLDGTLVYRL